MNLSSKAIAADSSFFPSTKCSRNTLGAEYSKLNKIEIRSTPFSNDTEIDFERLKKESRSVLSSVNTCVNDIIKSLQAAADKGGCSS